MNVYAVVDNEGNLYGVFKKFEDAIRQRDSQPIQWRCHIVKTTFQ